VLSAIATELASLEERASTARRMRAARDSLISAEWYESPDALAPDQYLTLAASPQEIRRGVPQARGTV